MNSLIKKTLRATLHAVFLSACLWAGPSQASFHLYVISEIYSSPDGTVQYIELFEPASAGLNGQNFLSGHQVTSSGAAAFNIPSNLPSGNTLGTHVLFATQAFANLNVVTPDYIIPANFIPVTGGTVNYAGVSSVTFPALPTDGSAISSNGASKTPQPTNFAGATGTLQAAFTPQAGFWFNPAESGRGYVIEIHGSNLFIGGFMYDASGNAVWYSSGPAAMTNGTTYINTWQLYGGGQTLTGAYKVPTIVDANVGALTIQFTSATQGTLTLPTGTQIPISRFPF
jgi:hypothetical protein